MMGGGDLTDWALEMEAKRKKVKNYDIQVVTAWGPSGSAGRLDPDHQPCGPCVRPLRKGSGARIHRQDQDGGGLRHPEDEAPRAAPAEMDNSIIELLDLAGYLTFREYDGLDDFYVYHTKMMSPDGSDFRYAEDVRVKNKIIRETREGRAPPAER